MTNELPEGQVVCYDERKEKIRRYFHRSGITARYEYDFGDDWQHLITFEEELPRQGEGMYPRCIDGRRHCRPRISEVQVDMQRFSVQWPIPGIKSMNHT